MEPNINVSVLNTLVRFCKEMLRMSQPANGDSCRPSHSASLQLFDNYLCLIHNEITIDNVASLNIVTI